MLSEQVFFVSARQNRDVTVVALCGARHSRLVQHIFRSKGQRVSVIDNSFFIRWEKQLPVRADGYKYNGAFCCDAWTEPAETADRVPLRSFCHAAICATIIFLSIPACLTRRCAIFLFWRD